ncbi:MAG: polysaccharide deacetylase family protein [Oscillospiraceae bacterium]|nr:polysaccharide deacetylase family protein [Oscillospiraceae bacterium]
MKKTIVLSLIIMAIGCALLFTGCVPNVNNDGVGVTDNSPLETTPRSTFATPPHVTTPNHTTPEARHNTEPENHINETNNEEAAVGDNPTAFNFSAVELGAPGASRPTDSKIGWGLGKATDERNRPLDALNAQSKYGHLSAVFIDSETDNQIYLTFDEGYENGFSPRILDVLRDKNVRATFFVTYDYCKNEPELIQRMLDDGHELGNHSWSHPSFPSLTDEQIAEEITKLHDYVYESFGYEMRLIRFPMGEFSERVLAATQNAGYKSIFWSFAYADWNVNSQPSTSEAFSKITQASHPGAVILLHAVSCTNAEILAEVIDYWTAQGLKLSLIA